MQSRMLMRQNVNNDVSKDHLTRGVCLLRLIVTSHNSRLHCKTQRERLSVHLEKKLLKTRKHGRCNHAQVKFEVKKTMQLTFVAKP